MKSASTIKYWRELLQKLKVEVSTIEDWRNVLQYNNNDDKKMARVYNFELRENVGMMIQSWRRKPNLFRI